MAIIKMRLRIKLLLGFLAVTILGLSASFMARIYLEDMGKALKDQYHQITLPAIELFKVSDAFQRMGIATRDILLATNDADLNRATNFMDGQKNSMEEALKNYEGMITAEADKSTLKEFQDQLKVYQDEIAKLTELASDGDQTSTGPLLKKLRTDMVGLQVSIDTLLSNMETAAQTQADAAGAKVQTLTMIMVILGLVTLVISLLLGLFISGSISRSVSHMGTLSARIAQGDLTGTLSAKLLKKQDEVGDLSRSIESMKKDILSNISGIKDVVGVLGNLGRRLEESADTARSVAQEIEAGMNQASQKVVDQAAGVTETSATISQIMKSISQLDHRIEEQSSAVTESSSSIEEMISNIHSVTKNVERMGLCFDELKTAGLSGNDKLEAMAKLIQEVASHSEKLLEANIVVDNIASQTNLLAMNAAIEAAHAGESGKGFSVVADEIRKLAESASLQSRVISQDIHEIRSVIGMIVTASGETGQAFSDIMKQMDTLGQMESEIKGAMAEQGEGSKQILEAIKGINGVTADVYRGSRDISEASQAIAGEMNHLMSASQILQDVVQNVRTVTTNIAVVADEVVKTSADSASAVKQLSHRVEQYKV